MHRRPAWVGLLATLVACNIYGKDAAGPGDGPTTGACYFVDGTVWDDGTQVRSCDNHVAEAECTAGNGYPSSSFSADRCCSPGLAEVLVDADDCDWEAQDAEGGGGGGDASDPNVACRASGDSCDPFAEAARPQVCVRGTYCRIDSYRHHACEPVAESGGRCGDGVGNSCPPGETCHIEDRGGRDPTGICEAAPGEGEPCDAGCDTGLWCERPEGGAPGTCEEQAGDGEACRWSVQCRSDWCSPGGGRCAPYPCPAGG